MCGHDGEYPTIVTVGPDATSWRNFESAEALRARFRELVEDNPWARPHLELALGAAKAPTPKG